MIVGYCSRTDKVGKENCAWVFSQNPGKQGQEIQNSTAELIIGLVQLVPLTHTSELSQEAMEVHDSISAVVVIFI